MAYRYIDEKALGKWVDTFIAFLVHNQGNDFVSFADSEETVRLLREERYKATFYNMAFEQIQGIDWNRDQIGDGIYSNLLADFLKSSKHNLVFRFQKNEAIAKTLANVSAADRIAYDLFATSNDEMTFSSVTEFYGKRYDVVAFIFSLKGEPYLPISGQLETAFQLLNIDMPLNNKCSWENYSKYCTVVGELHSFIKEHYDPNATLMHAHSFLWVLSRNREEIESGAEGTVYIGNAQRAVEEDLDYQLKRDLNEHPREAKPFVIRPEPKGERIYSKSHRIYVRSQQKATNALAAAGYKCEFDETHETFEKKSTGNPYTEPHHLIPLAFSDEFNYSLDTEANIVSLCSNCHNRIHYGEDAEKLVEKLYDKRKEQLEQAGIGIDLENLKKMYD